MKHLRLAGPIGAFLLWTAIVVAGLLTPGYSQSRQAISELGMSGAPAPWVVNWLGLVVFGISAVVTAYFVASDLSPKLLARTCAVLLALGGLGIALVGLSPCGDPVCNPTTSAVNHRHQLGATLGFTLIPLASLVLGLGALKSRPRRELYAVSIALAILMFLSLALFLGLVRPPLLAEPIPRGIWQRTTILFMSLWVAVLGFKLHRLEASAGESEVRTRPDVAGA